MFTTPGQAPQVALDRTGDGLVVWLGNAEFDWARYRQGSDLWSGGAPLGTTTTYPEWSVYHPGFAMAEDGGAVAGWIDPNGDGCRLRRFGPDGWADPGFLAAEYGPPTRDPALGLSADGKLIALYESETTGETAIVAAVDDGAEAAHQTLVTSGPFRDRLAAAVDSDGTFIAWWRKDQNELWGSRLSPGETTWEHRLIRTEFYPEHTLAVSPRDPSVIGFGGGSDHVFVGQRDASGEWSSKRLNPISTCGCNYTIATTSDDEGNMLIAWFDEEDVPELHARRYDADEEAWQNGVTHVLGNVDMSASGHRFMAGDARGNAMIASGPILQVRRYNAAHDEWLPIEQLGNEVDQGPWVAMSEVGTAMIAWSFENRVYRRRCQ
jgi:hypothetical protein